MAGSDPTPHAGARIEREGARVLVLDPQGRLLVLRGHDPHQPERSWWFTPGGGLEGAETALQAAVRELEEETGYRCRESDLVGPVWERTAVFDFMSTPYVQHEVFFVLRLPDDAARADVRFTEAEEETVDEAAWLTERELHDATIEVFPEELRQSWDEFRDWAGTTRDLGEGG